MCSGGGICEDQLCAEKTCGTGKKTCGAESKSCTVETMGTIAEAITLHDTFNHARALALSEPFARADRGVFSRLGRAARDFVFAFSRSTHWGFV